MDRIAMNRPPERPSRVISCSGARATERRLIEEIDRVSATRPEDLARPVRIVVPSRSLRHHLIRTMTRRRRGIAGLNIQTLFGLAMEVLTRSGLQAPAGDAGFEVLVRRLAAAQPSLQLTLGELIDGYDAVVGAVRDLLDAGFQPGNEDGVIERLDEVSGEVAPERVERARSLVRLAREVLGLTDELGVWRTAQALQLAEDVLHTRGLEVLPTRALFVHGFADVTGVATDLLLALIRIHGGTVILDRPLDPADPSREDSGSAFLSRFDERLAHLDHVSDSGADGGGPPNVQLVEAPDLESEARWVAERARAEIDSGVEPEDIGVVSRNLESFILPLRRHFRRLGVPFSGCGATVPGAVLRRRLARLAELIRAGAGADVDLWFETLGPAHDRSELLLGLRVLGLLRVADVAGLASHGIPARGVILPVAVSEEEEGEDGDREHRVLQASALEQAAADAGELLDAFTRWSEEAPAHTHRRHAVRVLDALGWNQDSPHRERALGCLDSLSRELPPVLEVSRSEWLKLAADRLLRAGEVAAGGHGAGVQILSVVEARARTFERLLMSGVSRGVFPRVVHEDPMLPEAVRARLAADVLPEMPVKGRSADEERYLFAQLLSSAPIVELSWHLYGGDGTLTPSPFVERLRLREDIDPPEPAPQLWPVEDAALRPRPAYELAVLAAPSTDREEFESLLGSAVSEDLTGAGTGTVAASELALARADILSAIAQSQESEDPGPWFGFVGGDGRHADDPMWVTRLEATGICPWRAFVQQRLGIAPLPDPHMGLPGVGGLLVGQVVHAVLENVVLDAISGRPADLGSVLAGVGTDVPWPSAQRFGELVRREALRIAAREGLATIGMAPLLEARARQYLAVARELEWGDGGTRAGILASEVEGTTAVRGLERPLAFRADRVDIGPSGPELVDYKAAKPVSTAGGEDTRESHLVDKIAKGRLLQAAAYAGAVADRGGSGRYLSLKPDNRWNEEIRNAVVHGDDEAVALLFENAVRGVAEVRSRGIVFPRLEEADGRAAKHCEFCSVAEACRRDDSGFRRRLVEWMQGESATAGSDEAAARDLWWLGVDREGGGR
jgi:hypothetical protein